MRKRKFAATCMKVREAEEAVLAMSNWTVCTEVRERPQGDIQLRSLMLRRSPSHRSLALAMKISFVSLQAPETGRHSPFYASGARLVVLADHLGYQ